MPIYRISYEGAEKHQKKMLPKDSICFVCIGATIGKICMTSKKSLTNQQINSIIVDTERHDPFFVYYLLSTCADRVKSIAGGAATPIVKKSTFEEIDVVAPPLPVQQKIACILSAYDDLIENNTRRIQILEEMAQRIYREWFVHFRFPGHENVKMMESELGRIPENWKIAKVGDCFKTVLGGTPSRRKPEYWDAGNIPWINSSKVNELRILNPTEYLTEEGYKKSSTKLMPIRTTVIAITGATLGQVSVIEKEMCANQSVVGIYDENSLHNEYIYLTFSNVINDVINRASGGAQQHINKEIVNSTKIVIPALEQMNSFIIIIRPIFDLIKNLLTANIILRQTRDLLLPKLISGKIDVSELDIDIGANAE